MSNQELQNQNKTTEEGGVDKKRRRFVAGASVAAPIVLTLTSPSVFGAGVQKECYSQQMSGNASGTPGSCVTGNTPLEWLNNPSWPQGFTRNTSNGNGCDSWTGGTLFNASNAFPNDSVNRQMSAILCTYSKPNHSSVDQTLAYFVTAILNAQTPGYVLTSDQVRGLRTGTCPVPPGYTTVDQFLASTWP